MRCWKVGQVGLLLTGEACKFDQNLFPQPEYNIVNQRYYLRLDDNKVCCQGDWKPADGGTHCLLVGLVWGKCMGNIKLWLGVVFRWNLMKFELLCSCNVIEQFPCWFTYAINYINKFYIYLYQICNQFFTVASCNFSYFMQDLQGGPKRATL